MSIVTRTVSELKDHEFYVPSYQRGYRWTEHEVRALLDDVGEFRAESGQRYCLQPLIVKRREDGSFEVVDGQQRLTTVFIFMKIAAQEIRSATPPYTLEYETRSDSAQFLESLRDEMELDSSVNIDFHHIAAAYRAMNDWLREQPDESVAIQTLNTKFRQSVFFIWYEIPEDIDPIDVFTKVNLGKIPLTNSELIKALLMSRDNYAEVADAEIHKLQTEMSVAWDRIEHSLRNDSLWYFLNQSERPGTRIDFLFDLLAKERNAELRAPVPAEQTYYSFQVFSALLAEAPDAAECVKAIWDAVEKLYAEFSDWYADLDRYHVIGYLIATGVGIEQIFELTRGKRKTEVERALLAKTREAVGSLDGLRELSLGGSHRKEKIRRILLLFNIATLVCKSEKQYRFPFDIYKGHTEDRLKWDIEHIHATADETDDADDSLGNLALLDAATNRGYGDAPFDEKRRVIIERDSKGRFVPLCTRNVFLKTYSQDLSDMSMWGSADKTDYVDAMETTFETFFSGAHDE